MIRGAAHRGRRLRRRLAAAAAVLLLAALFSQRPAPLAAADPPRHQHAVDEALSSVAAAGRAMDEAAASVAAAIDATRHAAANASTGTALEEPRFEEAAAAARATVAPLERARDALAATATRCVALGLRGPQLSVDVDDGTAIADEIESSATSAEGFIGLRTDAATALEELAASGRALETGRIDDALAAADRAEAALARVEPFAVALPTLRLWLETSRDLLAAVRDAAQALRDGDPRAAAAARDRLRDAAAEAAVSDRALALATSEGASRVLGTPLQALADLARHVEQARTTLDSLHDALVARSALGEAP